MTDPDVSIEARLSARELRHREQPRTRSRVVELGDGEAEALRADERGGLPKPIEPGVTYRRVRLRWRLEGRLVGERDPG